MTRAVPAAAIAFLKLAEACRLTAYQDSKGVWTIGVGHTGPEVVRGLTITIAQALAYLMADLGVAASRLAGCVGEQQILALTDNQYSALLSFVFNLGAEPGWTIWKLLNDGKPDGVPDQMKRFDKARIGGQLVDVPGLMHRRLAEVALWNTPDAPAAASAETVAPAVAIIAAAPVAPPPSSTTRCADTPPTPPVVTPLKASPRFLSTAAASVATVTATALPAIQGASGGVKQATDALTPYADQVPFAAHAVHVLLGVAAVLSVLAVVVAIVQHQVSKRA